MHTTVYLPTWLVALARAAIPQGAVVLRRLRGCTFHGAAITGRRRSAGRPHGLTNSAGLLAVALGGLFSAAAGAAPFTLYLTGSMETVTSRAGAEGLAVGDRFDLALTLDPGAVTDSFTSPFAGQPNTVSYFGGVAGLTGTLAGTKLALGAPLTPGSFNPAEVVYRRGDTASPDRHIVQFGPAIDTAFGDARITRLVIGFLDNDGTFLASTDFTEEPFSPRFLGDLEQATVQFQFEFSAGARENPLGRPTQAGLRPFAPVPAPPTWLLLLAAIPVLRAERCPGKRRDSV